MPLSAAPDETDNARALQANGLAEPGDIEHLERENADLRARLDHLSTSVRFRLGSALVDAAASPKALLRAPAEVGAILVHSWRLRRWRRLAANLDLGLPDDPLRRASPNLIRNWSLFDALQRAVAARAPASWFDAWIGLESPIGLAALRAGELIRILDDADAWFDDLETQPPLLPAESGDRVMLLAHASAATTTNGYTRRTQAVASALSDQGWRVAVYARSLGKGLESCEIDGVDHRALAPLSPRGDRLADYLAAYADAAGAAASRDGVGIIHACSNYLTGLAGAKAARQLGLPFVYELRGFWEVTRASVEPGFDRSVGYAVQSKLEAKAAQAANRVVTLNAAMAASLRARGVTTPISIAPNAGPDAPSSTEKTPHAIRAELGLQGAPVIGFVGSLTPYEGLELLIDVLPALARRFPDVRLLVVGDGPSREALEGRVRRKMLSARVRFVGRVTPAKAFDAYRVIDVAPFPRADTPVGRLVTPLKPLEAIAAGVPIVIARLAPLLELADAGRLADSFPADDRQGLADSISRVLADPDAARERAVALRVWVQERFTWTHAADVIGRAYADCLGADA